MRFAAFNLENLFQRPALFSVQEEREDVLNDFERMNTLIAQKPMTNR